MLTQDNVLIRHRGEEGKRRQFDEVYRVKGEGVIDVSVGREDLV
jgi:hypothetical protein